MDFMNLFLLSHLFKLYHVKLTGLINIMILIIILIIHIINYTN